MINDVIADDVIIYDVSELRGEKLLESNAINCLFMTNNPLIILMIVFTI